VRAYYVHHHPPTPALWLFGSYFTRIRKYTPRRHRTHCWLRTRSSRGALSLCYRRHTLTLVAGTAHNDILGIWGVERAPGTCMAIAQTPPTRCTSTAPARCSPSGQEARSSPRGRTAAPAHLGRTSHSPASPIASAPRPRTSRRPHRRVTAHRECPPLSRHSIAPQSATLICATRRRPHLTAIVRERLLHTCAPDPYRRHPTSLADPVPHLADPTATPLGPHWLCGG